MTLKEEDWAGHWEKLFEKLDSEGYESLTADERIWFHVRGLIDSVSDGGIISFYYNHGADYMDDVVEDLRKLDLHKAIGLLSSINALFPDGRPSPDVEERNDAIDEWDGEHDDLLEAADESFFQMEAELESSLEAVIGRIISK